MTFHTFKCPECKKKTIIDVEHTDTITSLSGVSITYYTTSTNNRKYYCEHCGGELGLWNII